MAVVAGVDSSPLHPAVNPPDDLIRRCVRAVLDALVDAQVDLGRLDTVAGDGDHGVGVVRGARAAVAAAEAWDGTRPDASLLETVGDAFADAAGGSSGALYGTLAWTFGHRLRTGCDVGTALGDAVESVMLLGDSAPGDKTFLDTLVPFADSVKAGIASAASAERLLATALAAAEEGAHSTTAMVPRRGRAAALAERSVGTPDPGAVSMLHILRATVDTLSATCA